MLHGSFLLGLLFGPEVDGDMFLRNVGWFSLDVTACYPKRYNTFVVTTVRTASPTNYRGVLCPQLCISALVLLVFVGAEDVKEKKQEKRGLLGLGYGTLGGYGVGSGLTGYTGNGLAGLALPPAPVPVAAHAPGPVLPPPPVYAPSAPVLPPPPVYAPHLIGSSVYTTITKQVSTEVIPCPLLLLLGSRTFFLASIALQDMGSPCNSSQTLSRKNYHYKYGPRRLCTVFIPPTLDMP
jgi:hypothetical protein